ncbi:PcfJ domain-containing protein [Verrucomicrobiota bacterium sgz303538]
MNPYHGREFARPQEPITPVILRGDAWKARRIQNNCLRQHCHALATTFRRHEFTPLRAVCARILFVLETRSKVLTDIHPTELAVVAGVARLGAYADQWLRQPEDWWPDAGVDARSQWADLLRHLLSRYPVPAFLDYVWLTKGTLEHFERDCWCALASGRSLRDVPGFPRSIPRRVLHATLTGDTSARSQTLAQAIWLAQLRVLDASPALEAAVMASRVQFELGNYALWLRLAEKFSADSDARASRFGFVADTLVAVRAHRGPTQVEQLLRLPLAALIRHCIRFITSLLDVHGHVLTDAQVREAAEKASLAKLASSHWQPLLGTVPFASKRAQVHKQATWQVEELCSVDALRNEGQVLSHCVARYAYRCRTGSSAIFSVRHYKANLAGGTQITSYATIEVHPRTRKVVQIRGNRNRTVNNTIMTIIYEWSAAKGLVYSK